MTLTLQDVEKIAGLARLELSEEEKETYLEQLSAILEYAARLNLLDTEDVLPTTSAVTLQNVMREDVVEPSLSIEDVLFNAPESFQGQFLIQAVLDAD
jgi:aspartyl-tRNA(Asn)/glutamyl-tRNA(Gln) amidotransferase subunit C